MIAGKTASKLLIAVTFEINVKSMFKYYFNRNAWRW